MAKKPKMKIDLNFDSYRDKVYACWIGKNIGGTMGGPFEGKRELLDVKGYTTAANVVLPNDDLDLQLVWLLAVEKLGAKAIDTKVLGEFWVSYIVPHWNEYGEDLFRLFRVITRTTGSTQTARGSVQKYGLVWLPAVPTSRLNTQWRTQR